MNSEIHNRINRVFEEILGSSDQTAAPIDSVAYVELLIAFQNEFKIKFSTQEFFSLRSVKNIRESVEFKVVGKGQG